MAYYPASKIQRAYRKSMFRRRLRNRKRKTVKRKVKTNTRRINKLVNAQKSYVDNFLTYSVNGTTGSIANMGLNTISQGTTLSQRTGDKITVKSITLNGFVQNALSTLAADAFNNIRIIVLNVTQPNLTASPLAVTDFLEIANYLSLYKKRPAYKYKVLYDKHWLTNSQTSGGATWQPVNPFRKHFTTTINFPKGLDVTYAPGTTTPITNNIKILLLSDSLAIPHPSITFYSRINYII
jgi:hypothetical protein